MIVDKKRYDSDAWRVEMDPLKPGGEPRTVVVPAAWVEADEEASLSRKNSKRRRKSKSKDKDQENFDEKDDDYEDEEEVFLDKVEGGTPKPTPAQGGSAHDEDEEEGRQGVQCQQM